MAEITEREFKATYELGKQVYENQLTRTEAVRKLVDEYQMNKNSASMSIQFLTDLLTAKEIRRTVSIAHLKYYADRVLEDYGKEAFETFLEGLKLHIHYHQNRGKNVPNFCDIHNEYSEKIGIPLSFGSVEKRQAVSVKHGLMVGALLKDSWQVANTGDYKIGFARKNEVGHPLDLYEANPYEWQTWVQHRPKNNDFNRKYVFTLVQFYHEPDTWIFSGVFEVLSGGDENATQYKMKLTDQLKEYVGRLKISHSYKLQSPRTNMEPHYSEFIVKEILDDPYFIIAEDSQLNESEDDMENTDSDYTIKSIAEDGCFIEEDKLATMLQRIKEKKNFILQGPPGTGKTWLAKKLGYALVGKKDRNQVMSVQFHPNMSYEDFVMGYRPAEDGKLKKDNGIFMEFVEKAHEHPDKKFVMVIEEINRGNPAQIFGEMLTLLEADKRNENEALRLCYQDEYELPIYIPKNFYVIGTMNLADRSLAVVDFALRRRFAFTDLEPELNHLWLKFAQDRFNNDKDFASQIQTRMKNLNARIKNDPSLGKQFCIGHSFITPIGNIDDPKAWFKEIVNTEIRPLLEEYWFDAIETSEDGEITTTKTQAATEELLNGI